MVQEILKTGHSNAIPGNRLAMILGIPLRAITRAIEQERRDGAPICASTDSRTPGYFLAGSYSELEKYCTALQRRAEEIHATRRAILQRGPTLPGKEERT